MAIDLINIDNLVLANDFEKWFERTNEIIDALNPLQMYDFYDNFYTTGDGVSPTIPGFTGLLDLVGTAASGFVAATTLGLKITRDVRFLGDMLIEVFPEAPLGFNTVTGQLAFVFTGPNAPPLLGTSCTPPNNVADDDRYIVWDDSASVTKVVEASNMLPPILNCDHQFGTSSTPGPGFVTITIKGDLIVDGTTTTLSTLNLEVEDKNINLNHDGGGTPGVPGGDDTTANLGGITLLSTDGNKNIEWRNAGDRWFVNQSWEVDQNFDLFTTTIETQSGVLDLQGGGGGPYPLIVAMRSTIDPNFPGSDDHWEFLTRTNPTVLPFGYTLNSYPTGNDAILADEGTFVLRHVASLFNDNGTAIIFDSLTPTNDFAVVGFARFLNADMLDGCHSSQTPTPFTIPCADANGEIDAGWIPFTGSTVKEVTQTGHGFIVGNVVRIEKGTATGYVLAQADTEERAEAVGVVENVIDANTFEVNLRGCIEATTGEWDTVTGGSGGLFPGGVYFLDKATAGFMTLSDPSPGDISKTMMVAIDATTAIVMNYVGGLTDPTTGTPTIELVGDVLAIGLLGSPLTTSIVERTFRTPAAGGVLPLIVQDNDSGTGNRTFEITMTASTTLELQQPLASAVDPVTNSVTLIVKQDAVGGHVPTITINAGGVIHWDNSLTQPVAQSLALKSTIYVLVNVNDIPGVWYGSRAVFEV